MTRIDSWDNPELNLELFFCTEVLKLNSLHYGYWQQAEKVDLESIRRAQTRYTDTLLEMIPADVHTILDIGCGIGDNARALAAHGYQVTALSPDRNHLAYFKDDDPEKICFINTSIEAFTSSQRFDLVLMSESQGYFAMDMGFSQSIHHLRPGGYLLVSGIFKQDNQAGFRGSHVESEYVQCAREFNLVQTAYTDITDNVLPTLEYANQNYQAYFAPLTRTAAHFIGKSGRRKIRMLRKLFAQEFADFEEVQRYYEEHFNPAAFKDKMRYARILFQFQPAELESEIMAAENRKPAVSLIVPAFNEEATLDSILTTLAACPLADEVIVVNDGSGDGTAAIIQEFQDVAKIRPIHFAENKGKSNAMITGALRASGSLLVFVDADLARLSADHVQTLVQPLLEGQADMVIGDPQYRSNLAKLLDPFRPLSGQRALWRQDLLPLVENMRNSGFGIETLLNKAFKENGKKVVYQNLDGLIHPIKLEKEVPLKAASQYLHEGRQIASALVRRGSPGQSWME